MVIYPCKNCQSRTFDCHIKCEDYLQKRKENDELNKFIYNKRIVGESFFQKEVRVYRSAKRHRK